MEESARRTCQGQVRAAKVENNDYSDENQSTNKNFPCVMRYVLQVS